jgi:hypothetical protein
MTNTGFQTTVDRATMPAGRFWKNEPVTEKARLILHFQFPILSTVNIYHSASFLDSEQAAAIFLNRSFCILKLAKV